MHYSINIGFPSVERLFERQKEGRKRYELYWFQVLLSFDSLHLPASICYWHEHFIFKLASNIQLLPYNEPCIWPPLSETFFPLEYAMFSPLYFFPLPGFDTWLLFNLSAHPYKIACPSCTYPFKKNEDGCFFSINKKKWKKNVIYSFTRSLNHIRWAQLEAIFWDTTKSDFFSCLERLVLSSIQKYDIFFPF